MSEVLVAGALQNVDLRISSDEVSLGVFTLVRNERAVQKIRTVAGTLDHLGSQLSRRDYSMLKASLRLFAASLAETIVTFPSTGSGQENFARYYRPFVTALRLYQPGFVHGGYLEHAEHGARDGLVLRGYQFPQWQIDRPYLIDDEMVQGLRRFTGSLDPVGLEIHTALDMFDESYGVWRADARLIRLITCLEAALGVGTPSRGAGGRIAAQVAEALEEATDERRRIRGLLHKAYKARNAVVHSKDGPRWRIIHSSPEGDERADPFTVDLSEVETVARRLLVAQLARQG